jgi:hypothetical protein
VIRSLLAKELAEHWKLLLLVVTLQLACLSLLLVRANIQNDSISLLTAFGVYLLLVSPIAASVAMQALFAKEVRNKTILFLETLPLSRAGAITAKAIVAVAFHFGGTLAALGLVLLAARRSEPIDPLFVWILAAKTAALTAITLSVTFLASVLGRYRWPFYLSLLALSYVYEQAGGELDRVPPFSLLGSEFATERYSLPVGDLSWLVAAAVAIGAFGLLLLLLRGGSAALLLGERMAHREKVLVAGVLLSSILAADLLTDEKPEPPYKINDPSAIRVSTSKLTLTVVPPPEAPLPLESAVELLHSSLASLQDLFGVNELPPVFVIHRDDLDDHRFEAALANKRDGVVVRANLAGDRLALRDLLAFTTGALIDEVTDDRSQSESRRWLRDGFAEMWAEQQLSPNEGGVDDELWLRALHARRVGFDLGDVDRWFIVQESLGEPVAAALAWSGLVELERVLGREGTRELLLLALQPHPPDGLRGLKLGESRRFEALLPPDLDPAAFFGRWRSRLEQEASRLETRLARIPRFDASVTITGGERSRKVTFSATADPPLGETGLLSLLWTRLPAIDDPLSPLDLAREERPFDRAVSIVLPAPFPSGARVLLAGSVYSAELGCDVRFGVERRTVP